MSQSKSRRVTRVPFEEEPLSNRHEVSKEGKSSCSMEMKCFVGKRRNWQTQPLDMIAAHMNQPHFALNLFSIVFFSVGCLMLLISSHQQVAL